VPPSWRRCLGRRSRSPDATMPRSEEREAVNELLGSAGAPASEVIMTSG
jgi:hypothetical protein